ncbi:MAG TPA: hypothetical protein VF599_10815 [Pyrinomonadaceae bacterium]|jgi:hypothetical protein
MEMKTVKINGYSITQLSKNTYQVENLKQHLDFYFDAKKSNEVQVVVFNSVVSANSDKAYLGVFFSSSLEEAVSDVMQLTKDNVKSSVMWS